MIKKTERFCLALDLADSEEKIAGYCQLHQKIWPEVAAHIRQHGVTGMEIYRLGTRLVMVMEVDDTFDEQHFARQSETNPVIQRWETLMWEFQRPTPWTPEGEKWVRMEQIFSLHDQ